MTWDTKEQQAFLVDIDTSERLAFQFNPNEIVDEKSTAYATIRIPGMSHPRYQFVAGEARRISVKIQLFKGPVRQQVAWLQSLCYPEHAGTMLKNAPHRVMLVYGQLYPGLVCIVKQVKARFFELFDRESLLPQRAEVDLTLEEYIERSVEVMEVRL
ncbi:CIS-tube domain-containing protein [Sulfidibacter corallicola]|uniref:Contractile injection system tube protein N-terminal domain-containing protein n=1 Tax=Sulfidibacter corallicola TaxID=2818388 RepID=A0A8A4TXI3_SULCO|nr:hypothetical protein [Sulfidibacter corallicola]QTD54200.1 hypothetical protein J3U87_17275 [Sulfidibacter corallicola]